MIKAHECISLREYVEKILEERQRAVELQFDATSKHQSGFVRVIDEKQQRVEDRLKALEAVVSNAHGRLWALGVAWSLVLLIAGWLISHGPK